ncbi:MAG: hypothetical protein K8F60_06820 [Melioribacteraceae bacterium]|nr:hypothetical protein [Melioribacteraceae bacterium]
MKIKYCFFLSLVFTLSINAQLSKGELKFHKKISDKNELLKIYQDVQTPFILINGYIYIPESPCLPKRDLGGDIEQRDLGGDVENRQLGGDIEDRSVGGDVEDRQLGGDMENRQLGGDIEDRSVGGDVEERLLGGDVEDRQLGGNIEDRSLSGDTEARSLGGDVEDRFLGGDIMELECGLLGDKTGFRIIEPPDADVYLFNGSELILVKDNRFVIN